MKTAFFLLAILVTGAVIAGAVRSQWSQGLLMGSTKSVPPPTAVAPLSVSANDTVTHDTVIAGLSCTVPAGSCTFNVNDPNGLVKVVGTNLAANTDYATHDGNYTNIKLQACNSGGCFPSPAINNFALHVLAPSGSAPAPAVAAGLTTPVIIADWGVGGSIQRLGAATVDPANMGAYIAECGAGQSTQGNPANWNFSWRELQWADAQGGFHPGVGSLPCSDLTVAADNDGTNNSGAVSDGRRALRAKLHVNETASNAGYLTWPTWNGQINQPLTGWLPNETMRVVTFRIDCFTQWQRACPPGFGSGQQNGNVAIWSTTSNYSAPHIDENDYETLFANCHNDPNTWGGSNVCVWGGSIDITAAGDGGPNLPFANTNMNVYHTIASLWTSDENGNVSVCQWVDPDPGYTNTANCLPATVPQNQALTVTNRYYVFSGTLAAKTFDTPPGPWNQDITIWVNHFEIWSCSNIGHGGCPQTPITHWP